MARKAKAYAEIGRRIADFGERQRSIAKVLRVSQQTVSKKLRGETAILITDLERLASHYKVPLTYFFEEEKASVELARAFERVKKGSEAVKDLVMLASRLPRSSVERVLELARLVAQGSKGGKRAGKRLRVAEAPGRYRK